MRAFTAIIGGSGDAHLLNIARRVPRRPPITIVIIKTHTPTKTKRKTVRPIHIIRTPFIMTLRIYHLERLYWYDIIVRSEILPCVQCPDTRHVMWNTLKCTGAAAVHFASLQHVETIQVVCKYVPKRVHFNRAVATSVKIPGRAFTSPASNQTFLFRTLLFRDLSVDLKTISTAMI